MEFFFDSANIDLIRQFDKTIPYRGVTTNPLLLYKAGINEHTFQRLREIKDFIGANRTIHIQIVSHESKKMLLEAEAILKQVGEDTCIKVPVTPEGMKTILELKRQGVRVTATTVVTQPQALLALAAGADFIAPYYDHICEAGIDGQECLSMLAKQIETYKLPTRILAANIKNMTQLVQVCQSGCHGITLNPQLLQQALTVPEVGAALAPFDEAWQNMHGALLLHELI